jgi:hypothetical protein
MDHGYIDTTPDTALDNLIEAPILGENTPPSTPSVSVSPGPNDQKMLDDNRKECIAAADEKIKQATEEKKQCEVKFPKKKSFFGLFGGKRRSRKNKNKSAKKMKQSKKARKHRKTASK